MAIEENYVKD